MHYYGLSMLISGACVLAAGVLFGPAAALLVAVLSVLEIGLSLDNAVVNAKILENWSERWRKIFLLWGILIAVVGMRLIFPILIVCLSTGLSPGAVIDMALNNQGEYARNMEAARYRINGFGGAFLLMVGLTFWFAEKHVHWMEWAETKLTRFGQIEGVAAAVTIGALFWAQSYVPVARQPEFFNAGVFGIAAFVLAHGLGTLVGGEDDDGDTGGKVVRGGAMGFLYIELLDASFSFDGVIGAFALTTFLPIIMFGLGSGALWVRSATIHLVETKALAEYRYLEHGAFAAILLLGVIMLAVEVHLPEWVVGLSGAALLAAALLHSIVANRRDARLGVGGEAVERAA